MKLNFFSLETMFRRIFRYLLKRYFGQYIIDFSQDELTYGLSHGKGSVENIQLNIEALNDLSEEYNLPIEFHHGSIDFISILVPWAALLSENTVVEVKGLKLVVRPKERPQDVSMFDSVWGSMTSSLQLAEECLNSNEDEEEIDVPDRSEGLEKIARTIDAVLANLKIRFQDSSLKIEHVMPYKGISVEIRIASAEYFDEEGVNVPQSGYSRENNKPSSESSAYSFKHVIFEGVRLFTKEFFPEEKPFIPTPQIFNVKGVNTPRFVPGSPEMPPTHVSVNLKKDEPSFKSDPVLISKINGQQELRLKLKQGEAVIGPKVDVEFNLGAFNLFLTPQQVHLLLTLMNGLIKPVDTNYDPSKNAPRSIPNKPMRPADYLLVEQELLRQQLYPDGMSRSLKNQQGWSSQYLDESDEDFQLMTMDSKLENTPSCSSHDDLASSFSSDSKLEFTGNQPHSQKSKSRGSSNVQDILSDPISELTHFHGCMSSLLIIILHDDSVQESFTGDANTDSSVSLKVQAETFFTDLLDLQLSGINFKDFLSVREPVSKLCETNHLRLMASGVVLDGNETSSSVERILKFNISFHQFEVLECLFNSPATEDKMQKSNYMELLTFVDKDSSSAKHGESCFKLSYSQVECTSQNRACKPPANKLSIEFGDMVCDVDRSLVDRIQTLLNFTNFPDHTDNKWDTVNPEYTSTRQISSKTEISVSSSSLTLNLRFPIPDFRSVHDMERAPWWQQNIHKEILVLVFQKITLSTTLDDQDFLEYVIQCQDIHGLFKMSNEEEAISFLRVSVDPDEDEDSRKQGFEWPRLVIRQMTKLPSRNLEYEQESENEMFSCSLSYDLIANFASDLSPFCSTSVVHGCKGGMNLSSDHDEIIKPADKDNMLNFVQQTANKSECVFEFSLQTVNIEFPDKDFFELLFNRMNSSLFLWTKTSLASTNTNDSCGFKVHIPGLDVNFQKSIFEPYSLMKTFNNDSNSDSEDEDGKMHMSYHDYHTQRKKQKHKKSNETALTCYSFSFAITKGSFLFRIPLTDVCDEPIPDRCGKLKLYIEDGLIFVASCYKGDPNEIYTCLLAEKSSLYHEGSSPVEKGHPVIQPLNSLMKNNMKCIIYESDSGAHLNPAYYGNCSKEMLKFAIHSIKNPKKQIGTIKIAIEVSGGTLRHYVVPGNEMWINQLIRFLKIDSYPVNGYTPLAIITELHLNLNNCIIDYRPFRLPYRTALTVENFNMSCNVTATMPSFIFRIISEELRFFISNNVEAKNVDLRRHYVCVIDTGLIDISIKTSIDEKDNSKFEMTISNNELHIRTCADSFKALLDLINYCSCNGDMETNQNDSEMNEIVKTSIKSENIDSESQNLDAMMAEAMKECSIAVNGNNESPQTETAFDYSNTDDEFCILEDDPGVGLIPKNGEPQIRMLTKDPIEIVDNHFSVPPGKSDILKAPKHFPNPLFSLTLHGRSLVWHLYGGSDFKKGNSLKNTSERKSNIRSKPEVTFADQGGNNVAVSFCKVTQMPKPLDPNVVQYSMEHVTINQNQETNSFDSWLHKGGPKRNHDVLMELQMSKVQFQHEIYPLDSEYASRYILLIHDIEVRDRLAISLINKFLYQYASKDLPRQSHANMIDVKAVYTRPDPKQVTKECSLKMSCRPLRLNIDQDALMFLVEFFQEVFDIPISENPNDGGSSDENSVPPSSTVVTNVNSYQNSSYENETFYRSFTFVPDVLIRIDYHGKRVQMEQGAVTGLILGLGQLNASEIKLKRLSYRHGLLGHKKLIKYALGEWQQDILKNQLPSLLGGVGPMHSFVQLIHGVKDLFYLPVAQYQKDGQIIRGLQRGASSFSTSTVIAALDLTSRLFYAVQGTAEIAFDMVSPGPSVSSKSQHSQEKYKKNSQPADIMEGVTTAYNVVKEGLEDTARTIYRVASTEHEHKGVPGAVGGVLRQIPPSLFKPIILGSEATSYVLDGVRHQLMPDAHQEDMHKWRTKTKK